MKKPCVGQIFGHDEDAVSVTAFRFLPNLMAALVAALLFVSQASAQVVTTVLSPTPIQHFVDNNGNALSGGKLFTYAAGTTTKLATYTNSAGVTPYPNPIILNTRGEPTAGGASSGIWLNPGVGYKFVLSPSTDGDPPSNPIWTLDQINVPPNPVTMLVPTQFGCVGNGAADDTSCMQQAINAASASGQTLYFDALHLYNITSALNITAPIAMQGPYRYGIWAVNQPTNTGPKTCTWGLLNKNTGITMLNATAITGSIVDLCIDMTGNAAVQPTSGAAIALAPPSVTTFQSGWHIERNTILQPFDGITINGVGVPSPLGCCGQGTTADGNVIAHNTIVDPYDAAIVNGKNTVFAATVGNIVEDNNIVCGKGGVHAGDGVVIYDGGMWYNGTQNGPESCNRGFAVIPGTIAGNPQWAQVNADGVFGDQSLLHDLVIQPQSGGIVWPFSAGGAGSWANQTSSTSNHVAAYIDCTATLSRCEDIRIHNMYFGAGAGSAGPMLDVEGGDGGPYSFQLIGSKFCQQGTAGAGATGIKLVAGGPNGQMNTGGYHWLIEGNVISGCGSGINPPGTGVSLSIATTNPVGGEIAFIGNDVSGPATPFAYTPNTATITDNVIFDGNLGLETAFPMITTASAVPWPGPYQSVQMTGPITMNTLGGGYLNQRLTIHVAATGFTFAFGGGFGTLCGSSNLTMVVGGDYQFVWRGLLFGSCWSHVQ